MIAATLLELLTGRPTRLDRFRAIAALVKLLAAGEHLVVIDESQLLTGDCIELLRYVHDQPTTRFGLVLVGGNGTWGVLSAEPMLASRVFRRVRFCALTRPQVRPRSHRARRDRSMPGVPYDLRAARDRGKRLARASVDLPSGRPDGASDGSGRAARPARPATTVLRPARFGWPGVEFTRGGPGVDVDVLLYNQDAVYCCEVKLNAAGLHRDHSTSSLRCATCLGLGQR